MREELKVKLNKGKELAQKYAPKIVLPCLAVGGIIAYVVLSGKDQNEDQDPNKYRVDDDPSPEELVGYDIWALMNAQDPKVVEFAPKLEEFCKENEISIMCDLD